MGITVTVKADRYMEMLQSFVTLKLRKFAHVQETW